MSEQQVADTNRTEVRDDENVTSKGNSTVLSLALFVVLFALFVGGLYVMSLVTMDQPSTGLFVGGLAMCLAALYATFDLVPRFLSK